MLNLTNESKRDFFTLTIKIYLKKKTGKSHKTVRKFWKSAYFQKFLIPVLYWFHVDIPLNQQKVKEHTDL